MEGYGVVVQTHLLQCVADIVPCYLIVGVDIDRLHEARERVRVSAEVVQRVSEVVEQYRVIRVDGQRLLVTSDRLIEPVDSMERVSLIVPCVLVAGIYLHGSVEGRQSAVDLAVAEAGVAEVVPYLGVIRRELERADEGRYRLRVFPLLVPYAAQARMTDSVVGIGVCVALASLDGGFAVACADVQIRLYEQQRAVLLRCGGELPDDPPGASHPADFYE